MFDATRTTTALLEGLHDADNDAAWSAFDARYRPILIAFSHKLGLGEADASDVAQETILQFIREYREGKYDRERGRLRSWLVGIARYRILTIRRKQATRKEAVGASAVQGLPDEATMTQIWESERRTIVLREALNELRANTKTSDATIRAFELLVLNQTPVKVVADQLDMSDHDVYLAKSRVAQRLRTIVARLESAFDADG